MKPTTSIILVVLALYSIDHAVAIQGGQAAAPGEFPYMARLGFCLPIHDILEVGLVMSDMDPIFLMTKVNYQQIEVLMSLV
ncbi:hypothetical protein GWI33_001884 [Rhynchophorus ferrugineus]|uniref:Uncharacterized protein n=1 Tax=Rhynchophorus ferrugineus TaxID=354439 RepID=A0A834LXA9_RHYFE|nr:hypothetical protein GWI33_001899 [Rhynchophorus ferrugineus]KAF7263550.1 hypothetical protein GWI33_001884 [Rhynchophorus ferrugineus]